MDGFYAIIPSNSNVKNTPAKFLNAFNPPIYLDSSEWEVALTEIHFKNSITTIHEDYAQLAVIGTPEAIVADELDCNSKLFFRDVPVAADKDLYNEYRKLTPDFEIFSKGETKRVSITYDKNLARVILNVLVPDTVVIIEETFARLLGFVKEGKADPRQGIPNILAIIEFNYGKNIAPAEPKIITHEDDDYLIYRIRAKQKNEYTSQKTPVTRTKLSLQEGTYTTPQELEKELNKNTEIKKFVVFKYDPRLNRFDLITKSAKTVKWNLDFYNGLNDVLGYTKTTYHPSTDPQKGELEVSLLRGINNIFIYCDLLEPIRVGNTLAPLLRTISYNSKQYGEMIHVNYTNPMYVKVNKSYVDTVEVMMCDAIGKVVPFSEGLTIVVLHFKRV